MAGHSQFKNIMFRKGAQDKKRARLFAKLAREITVSAKLGGEDPGSNPRLRSAMATARSNNMPKDNIERAVKKGLGGDDDTNFDEVRYEGYGPGGIAVIVDALTDNRNRTASEVRAAFNKYGGSLGETNSVSFMFDRIGEVRYPADAGTSEAIFEGALEAGASDVESGEEGHTIICEMNDLNIVRDGLEQRFGEAESARLAWKPQTLIAVDAEKAETLMKLLDALDENDDVQFVAANYDIDDDVLAQLSA
ncbi:MAG: YebC/PmpR family DNA-binding transcriptional regulator [Rhodospirillales bacterium]